MTPPRWFWLLCFVCVATLTIFGVQRLRYDYVTVGELRFPGMLDRWKGEVCFAVMDARGTICKPVREVPVK